LDRVPTRYGVLAEWWPHLILGLEHLALGNEVLDNNSNKFLAGLTKVISSMHVFQSITQCCTVTQDSYHMVQNNDYLAILVYTSYKILPLAYYVV